MAVNNKLGLALAAVALVAVTVVVTLIVVDDDEPAGDAQDITVAPTTTTSLNPVDQACLDAGGGPQVLVYFVSADSDGHMRRAADALRDDDRIARLDTVTQAEAYERFKEMFKDQPELVEQVRPESLPASIEVSPAEDVSYSELAGDLEDELTGVDEVQEMVCAR